jgi:hypothetical protein
MWQLQTSFDREILHYLPLWVFICGILFNDSIAKNTELKTKKLFSTIITLLLVALLLFMFASVNSGMNIYIYNAIYLKLYDLQDWLLKFLLIK